MGQQERWRYSKVYSVCLLQLCISFIAATVWYERSVIASYSALIGGLIGVIPQAYFTYKVFTKRGARAVQSVVQAFYVGEVRKLLLTAGLFIVVFVAVKPLNAAALITTFLLTQVAHIWALFLLRH